MGPKPRFPVDLVTFVEEILNRKLHFLSSVRGFVKRFFCLRQSVKDIFYEFNFVFILSTLVVETF